MARAKNKVASRNRRKKILKEAKGSEVAESSIVLHARQLRRVGSMPIATEKPVSASLEDCGSSVLMPRCMSMD